MKGVRSFPQVAVRMSPALKDWVISRATANHRSINSEIVTLIEESRRIEQEKKESSHG